MVLRYVLLQYTLSILFGFASMDRKRLSESNGVLELTDEDFLLLFPRRVVVVVVKPNFPPSNAAWMRYRL